MTAIVSDAPAAVSRRRLTAATFIGTAIEFYDFYLYGMAAALVFPAVFFPSLDPVAGTLAALSTFGAAFVARPAGALLFGRRGDRHGRKSTLVWTLLLTGLATVAIGLLPGYAAIGVAAPALLTLLRLAQGVGLGGEWAGAALLAAEHAPPGRRGRAATGTQLGPAAGFLLANGTFLLLGQAMDPDMFERWGWRVPFVASLLLVLVGLYTRLRLAEAPIFTRAEPCRSPLRDLLRHQWKEVLLAAGVMVPGYALFYTTTVYFLAYGTRALGVPRTTMLLIAMAGVATMGLTTALSASLSDRLGRRRTLLAATGLAAGWAAAMPPLIGRGWIAPAVVVALAIMGLMYGPKGALLPELFQTRYRYSGAALAYNLGGVVGGAVTPVVATVLRPAAVGWYLTGTALLGLLCLLAIDDRRTHRPLS
ncbi:MFS transporter [Actinomycetes bacterium KLBMP 9797]